MENQYEYYSCFTCYNARKQRVAIFASEVSGMLDITVIPCSKNDPFIKATARNMYETGNYKKSESFKVPIVENKPQRTFLRWCRANYYTMKTVQLPVYAEIYTKGKSTRVSLGKKYSFGKMDM